MGDRARFEVLADFIVRNFPDAHRVADVAGGTGQLAYHLAKAGYEVEVIDPRPSNLPRRLRRKYRKPISRRKEEFHSGEGYDLLVGLHPDEATEDIILEADRLGIPFVVVPCCVMPKHRGLRLNETEWIEYLAKLPKKLEVSVVRLPISGKNVAICGRDRGGVHLESPDL